MGNLRQKVNTMDTNLTLVQSIKRKETNIIGQNLPQKNINTRAIRIHNNYIITSVGISLHNLHITKTEQLTIRLNQVLCITI